MSTPEQSTESLSGDTVSTSAANENVKPDPTEPDGVTTDTDGAIDDAPHTTTASRTYSRKLSISEQASARSTRQCPSPFFLKWIEYPFRIRNVETRQYLEEATAASMDVSARGPINQTGSFVGSALIGLATIDAGCLTPGSCTTKIHGIKPSSLLSVGSLIVGISAGLTMPFVGAIVDHTDHRKAMGAFSALVMVVAVGVQIMISLDSWFTVYIFQILGGYFLIMHQVCTMAYLPDLSHDVTEIGHYTSRLMMNQYFVQGCYTSIIVGVSWGTGMNNLETARFASALSFSIGAPLMGYSWFFLFRKRNKLRDVPPNSNILTAGFRQLWTTAKFVFARYRALKWFMIALLWSPEAGAGVVLAIAVTFLTIYVRMSVREIALVSLTMLFCNIPGALISKFMCRKVNPLNSFRMAELLFAFANAMIAATVTHETKNRIYVFAGLAGLAFGWMFPSQRTLAVALIPKGQETEIMGLISFFGQIVEFLPSMCFTLMNEANVDLRWGLSLLSFFLVLSCICTLFCGSFEEAVEAVAHTSDAYLTRMERLSEPGLKSSVVSFGDVEKGTAQSPIDENGGSSSGTEETAEKGNEKKIIVA